MNCPVCKDTKLVMSERQGVEIDYCPNCRGVWLDRGELDKIIDKSAPSDSHQQSGSHRHDDERSRHYGSDSQKYGHKKKKEGFLGDLFDF